MCIHPDRRVPLLGVTLLAALGIGLPIVIGPLPRLIYNASASAPLGFYRLVLDTAIARGDLVLARLPPSVAKLAADRRYLPLSVPVVKHVAALTGDRLCVQSGVVAVNSRIAARALQMDSEGRPLMAWRGCRTLRPGEIFLLMPDVPASFDGRYFGPIPETLIVGRLVPLWTW